MVLPPASAGSFLNGEYILSRNVLNLERQPELFLILSLGTERISPSDSGRLPLQVQTLGQCLWQGQKARPGLVGSLWFLVETAAAVALGALGGGLCLVAGLLSDLPLAIS